MIAYNICLVFSNFFLWYEEVHMIVNVDKTLIRHDFMFNSFKKFTSKDMNWYLF